MNEQEATFDDVIKNHPELDNPTYRELWESDREHRETMLKVQNDFDEFFVRNPELDSPILRKQRVKDKKMEEYKQHCKDMGEFVASFDGCSVSAEIMGEWNVIRKEISDYLFSQRLIITGCSHMKEFFAKEKQHLDSIKNKLGPNAIEYQMICSLVAEAIILDIESCMILEEMQLVDVESPAVKKLSHQAMLKDSLNVLEDASSLNMEYQYKYEKFTPFYKSLSEKGRLVGLAKDEPEKAEKNKSGCLGIIILAIVSTLLCSFL